MHVHNNPLLCLQPGILGILLGVKMWDLYDDVAPPTLVGAWSMDLVLRQRIQYYNT